MHVIGLLVDWTQLRKESLILWSSGKDSAFALQGRRFRSLVRELRSHKLHSMAKKKRQKE